MMREEKNESGTDIGALLTPTEKQGRPRKNQLPNLQGERNSLLQKGESNVRRPRQKKSDAALHAMADNAFIGQQVHGVLDGSFDAGYLLTVRVGDSQTVLRGVVFEPSLSMPISKVNDIAPNVKITKREEHALPAPVQQPSPTTIPAAVRSPVPMLPTTTSTPPAFTRNSLTTPNTSFRDYQAPPAQMVQVSSGVVNPVTAGTQGSSPKAIPMSQDHSNMLSTGEAEPQQ